MALFTRALWPETVRSPYQRLALAFVLSPLILGALLAVLTFMVAGVSEPDEGAVVDYTLGVMPYLFGALLAFMLTFGVLGIGMLWAMAQPSMVLWALVGAGLGAVAGGIVGTVGGIEPAWVVPAAFGVLGWLKFLLIRGIAGIRAPARRSAEI